MAMSWAELGSYAGAAFAVIWPLLGFSVLIRTLFRKKNLASSPLAKHAADHGWHFVAADDGALRQVGYPNTAFAVPFPGACNVVRGQYEGRQFLAFEAYSKAERVAAEEEYEVKRTAVVAIAMPGPLPWLQVYPENLLTRALGDITFESDDFNRRFRVLAQDTRFAYDVLNPQNMARMLKDPRYAEFPIRFDGEWLWTWQFEDLGPALIEDRLRFLADTLAAVPTFVWSPR
ncbi:hypothetical protein DDK07_02225 [Mycobacteroides abscessus]|uniref:hypothetical protein n=1 Tax=Mycobacteroides abscessus TaxID=36809 RepID=UPI00069785B2|nr:hypothetical protein [Mycobacteroides abscessus]AMU57755.1 hypothetical protein A3O02_23200 [Mycobacteroides abscessus]MBN7412184.1 hypothetical protein [Mycobacteroides abscessus subsp. abscessus]MBN7444906.1 hypothetical protein [Mycobacteroides abscessus subsp. abscessus]MDM1884967.1 hypothetical protein [Mycobacteroides abscessus]MDM1891732.1 hypothetical protein [Mycobacteroides abscessus]